MKRAIGVLSLLVGIYTLLLSFESPAPVVSSSAVREIQARRASLSLSLPGPRPFSSAAERGIGEGPVDNLGIATQYVDSHRAEWKIQPHHRLVPHVLDSPLGATVVFQTYQGQYPVMGQSIEVNVDRNGEVRDFRLQYESAEEVDFSEALSPVEIKSEIADRFEPTPGGPVPSAVIYTHPADPGHPVAAYSMVVRKKESNEVVNAMFRASDGQLLGFTEMRSEIFDSPTNARPVRPSEAPSPEYSDQ